jgi:hypothetical protein
MPVANLQKHPKSPILEWLQDEEDPAPTCSRSARTLSAYVKIVKTPAGKSRRLPPQQPPPKTEAALAREPGGGDKTPGKHSQPGSFDHLLKLSRLPKLRAPYGYKPTTPPAPAAAPKTQRNSKARAARVKR